MLSFMILFPTLTRRFVIMMAMALFIMSVIMLMVIYITEVISIFLNISSVMMVSLMCGCIIQVGTENIFTLFPHFKKEVKNKYIL